MQHKFSYVIRKVIVIVRLLYVRFILYFLRIVICIFLGLYSLVYIRPPIVLVIYSL